MPTVPTIPLFVATAQALNVTPGPSILFILSRCLGQGRCPAKAERRSLYGLALCGLALCGLALCGLALCGLALYGLVIIWAGIGRRDVPDHKEPEPDRPNRQWRLPSASHLA